MDEKIKAEWEEKIRHHYGDAESLVKFMRETMNNIAYRFISTASSPTPQVTDLPQALVIQTQEDSMVNALKITHAEAKEGIKELAKRVPKAQKPTVQYTLRCELGQLKPDQGKLVIVAAVSWDFPEFCALDKQVALKKTFTWDDLQVFRKGFPLAVQEACDLFL